MLQGQATRACPTDITGLLVSSLTVPITDPSAKPEKRKEKFYLVTFWVWLWILDFFF